MNRKRREGIKLKQGEERKNLSKERDKNETGFWL